MKTIDAEKLKQFLKESISDIPQNLPEMYWTKGWNAAMTAMANKVDEIEEEHVLYE